MSHIERFTLKGYEGLARVVSVVDGDTVWLSLPLPKDDASIPCTYRSFRCRLAGVDTSELRSASSVERELASKGKKYTEGFAKDVGDVWVHCHHFDKYGRVLVDVYSDERHTRHLNNELVEHDLAKRLSYNKNVR